MGVAELVQLRLDCGCPFWTTARQRLKDLHSDHTSQEHAQHSDIPIVDVRDHQDAHCVVEMHHRTVAGEGHMQDDNSHHDLSVLFGHLGTGAMETAVDIEIYTEGVVRVR